MSKTPTYSNQVKKKYQDILEAYEQIDIDKVTVLTGDNGSGKSLIRTQMVFKMRDYLGDEDASNAAKKVCSTSMAARTGSNPEWGAFSSIMRDTEWVATSQNTFSSIEGLFKTIKENKDIFVIIDEFEIGCGEETILALVNYINKKIKEGIKKGNILGALIITHSRIGVENLRFDKFINIGGMNKENWLNRKIKPTDLEELDKNELFFYIRDLNNKEVNHDYEPDGLHKSKP